MNNLKIDSKLDDYEEAVKYVARPRVSTECCCQAGAKARPALRRALWRPCCSHERRWAQEGEEDSVVPEVKERKTLIKICADFTTDEI